MSDETNREKEIFNEALEMSGIEEGLAYVRRVCAHDAAVRERVEALLTAHSSASSFIPNRSASGDEIPNVVGPVDLTEGPGTVIDRYWLVEKIGEGGFGDVYRAEQREPIKRRVALKIIKLGMDTRQVVARFETERQALALMDHPNIAKVFDAGATQTGRPYFVMELVDGIPITQYCGEHNLALEERLHLFKEVCHAIQHAHQKGIIHRDLKPSNILVTLQDGVPLPKVIDFGIAKATQGELPHKVTCTRLQQFIGTPAYMSPEQAAMRGSDVDTRSDVYALGVLLYELLVGRTPFDGRELLLAGPEEMRRTICEKEPVRPSTRLHQQLAERQTAFPAPGSKARIRILHSRIPRDLDCIVMKCLEKERTRRYESASAVARDIKRFLNQEPVDARAPSQFYRFRKLAGRNKLALAAVTAVSLTLMAGLSVATLGWQQARIERDKAIAAQEREKAQRIEAKTREQDALEAEHQAELATRLAAQSEKTTTRNFYLAEMNLAGQAAAEDGGIGGITHFISKWFPKKGMVDQRGWEWYYMQSLTRRDLLTLPHSEAVQTVAWSPDRCLIATGASDNCVHVWALDTGKQVAILAGHAGVVKSVAWNAEGNLLASASADQTIMVWDAASGTSIYTLTGHNNGVNSVAWSPDGQRLATGSLDKTIKIWDSNSRINILTITGHTGSVDSVCWSPDGRRLASGSWDHTVKVWDAKDGTCIYSLAAHIFPVRSVAWSPDGKRLAAAMSSARDNHSLFILDADNGTNIHTLRGHIGFVNSVAWSPNGKRLATGSWDHTIKVWDADNGKIIQTKRGHTNAVQSVAWNSDGKHLASSSEDTTVKVWDAENEETVTLRAHTNGALAVGWSPDGRYVASGGADTTVRVWDATSRAVSTLAGHTQDCFAVAWSPDGKQLASASWDNTVRLWDPALRKSAGILHGHHNWVMSVAWSPDGNRLASASTDGEIKLWEGPFRQESQEQQASLTLTGHTNNWVFSLAWSPDGKRFASASGDHTVKVWDADRGTNMLILRGHTFLVCSVAWSPDGKRLASASFDNTVRIWNAYNAQEIQTLRGHTATVRSVAWSPDGRRLASASFDKTVKIWDADSGQTVLTLRGHTDDVFSVSWSPNGWCLASASIDNTIKLWDATRGYALERD